MSAKLERIKKSYRSKILAVRNYQADKEEFTIDDFIDQQSLIDIIIEINEAVCDITPAGKVFLKEYYGYESIAKMFVNADINLYAPKEKLKDGKLAAYTWWLENMKPMEITMLIAEARGEVINKDTKLKKILMPPDRKDYMP
ncbi:MAG: hypothetical protein V4702_03855 [Patescibacteria group bacterium]